MKSGDQIIWNQTRTWGGTQGMPATFLEMRGTASCRIRLSNGELRTVRVANCTQLKPSARTQLNVCVSNQDGFIAKTLEDIARMIQQGYFRGLKIGDKVTIEVEKFNPKEHGGPEWEGIQ